MQMGVEESVLVSQMSVRLPVSASHSFCLLGNLQRVLSLLSLIGDVSIGTDSDKLFARIVTKVYWTHFSQAKYFPDILTLKCKQMRDQFESQQHIRYLVSKMSLFTTEDTLCK